MSAKNLKKELKINLKLFRQLRTEFRLNQKKIIDTFNIDENEKEHIGFGLIIPANRSLQTYCDTLNSDTQLYSLNTEMDKVQLAGNLILLRYILKKSYSIPGYDIENFISFPNDTTVEINDLMLGLSGYKHIHIIGQKIALEIPAREHIKEDKQLLKLIDYWTKGIKN